MKRAHGTGSGEEVDTRGMARVRRDGGGWLVGGAVLVIFLCYSPVLFFEYGFSEDYRLLAAAERGVGLSRLMLAEGRPLFAVWAKAVFGAVGGISGLAAVRFTNIAFLAGLAVLMAAVWRRAGLTGFEAAAAGAAMVTLPPFQLFAGTAAMGAVLPAMLAATGAALMADGEAGREGGPRAGRLAAASLLAFAALATYQPSGLFFWVVIGILLIAPDPPPRIVQRKLLILAGTAMPAMIGAFAIFLAGRSAFPAELIDIGAPRAMLEFDPVGKASWFLTLPLPHALNLWKLWPSLTFAMVMVIIVAVGIGLHLRGRKDAWLRAALAIALVPVCYLPNLVIAEDRSSFRSQPALTAIVFVYIVIVLLGQFAGSRRWIAHTLLAAGVVAGAASASRNVVALIASPQAGELALVRETIAGLTRDGGSSTLPSTTDPAAQPPGVRLVGIVPSDYRDSLAPVVLYDEFGYPSTALPWSAYTLTWLVLAERMEGDTAAFHVTDARDAAAVPDTVIDWGEVLRAGR